MSEQLGSMRAYAVHRGCRLSAVQKAIAKRRLDRAVVRDAAGKIQIDFGLADQEWSANTDAARMPLRFRAKAAPVSQPSPAAERVQVQRLGAYVAMTVLVDYNAPGLECDGIDGPASHLIEALAGPPVTEAEQLPFLMAPDTARQLAALLLQVAGE